MKKLNLQIAFLLIGLLLSATSQASPPPHEISWNGYYFGAYYGAGVGNARTDLNSSVEQFSNLPFSPTFQILTGFTANTSGTTKGKVSGSIADLFFGYNFYEPSYNLVFGAQAEGSIFSDITWKSRGLVDSVTNFSIVIITPEGVTTTFDQDIGVFTAETLDRLRSKFALVGRVGYLINPCTLIYGLGGPVAGYFIVPAFDFEGNTENNHWSRWEVGYTLGAGSEVKLNDHWALRAEYRYLSFEIERRINPQSIATFIGLSEALRFAFSSSVNSQRAKTQFHDHLGEIGVVYSF